MRNPFLVVILAGIFSINSLGDDPMIGAPSALIPVTGREVYSPRNYTYQAPEGWKIQLHEDGTSSVCDMRGLHDCAAMISVMVIVDDTPLQEFARKFIKDSIVTPPGVTTTMGDLQHVTADSGWEGFKAASTSPNNLDAFYYFFAGHEDHKYVLIMTCHPGEVEHYTPIYDEVVKSLVKH